MRKLERWLKTNCDSLEICESGSMYFKFGTETVRYSDHLKKNDVAKNAISIIYPYNTCEYYIVLGRYVSKTLLLKTNDIIEFVKSVTLYSAINKPNDEAKSTSKNIFNLKSFNLHKYAQKKFNKITGLNKQILKYLKGRNCFTQEQIDRIILHRQTVTKESVDQFILWVIENVLNEQKNQ